MPVKFDESCLKKEKIVFTDNTIQNDYTVYKINLWPLHLDSKFTFKFTEIRYLELLSWLKLLIISIKCIISILVLDIVLDLMNMGLFIVT